MGIQVLSIKKILFWHRIPKLRYRMAVSHRKSNVPPTCSFRLSGEEVVLHSVIVQHLRFITPIRAIGSNAAARRFYFLSYIFFLSFIPAIQSCNPSKKGLYCIWTVYHAIPILNPTEVSREKHLCNQLLPHRYRFVRRLTQRRPRR